MAASSYKERPKAARAQGRAQRKHRKPNGSAEPSYTTKSATLLLRQSRLRSAPVETRFNTTLPRSFGLRLMR
jgi:hypothetical protein